MLATTIQRVHRSRGDHRFATHNLFAPSQGLLDPRISRTQVSTSPVAIFDGTTWDARAVFTAATSAWIYRVGVTSIPGTRYTYSAWYRSDDLSEVKIAMLDDSNGAWIYVGVVEAIGASWVRLARSFTAPAGCTSLRPYMLRYTAGDAPAEGQSIEVAGIQVNEGESPQGYQFTA